MNGQTKRMRKWRERKWREGENRYSRLILLLTHGRLQRRTSGPCSSYRNTCSPSLGQEVRVIPVFLDEFDAGIGHVPEFPSFAFALVGELDLVFVGVYDK